MGDLYYLCMTWDPVLFFFSFFSAHTMTPTYLMEKGKGDKAPKGISPKAAFSSCKKLDLINKYLYFFSWCQKASHLLLISFPWM